MNSPQKPLIIPIFIPHAGCPHQCVFCNQKIIAGDSPEFSGTPLADAVARFLSYQRPIRSHVEVSFYGGNFLGLPGKRVLRLLSDAKAFVDSGKIHSIRFSTRPDTIDENRMNLIAPFPVSTIELGAQSMDDRVLKISARGHTACDTVDAVSRLKEKGYKIGLQMMTGLPGDTLSGACETAQKIIALKPDFVRIYPTLVLEGSPLAQLFKKGQYAPISLEECVDQLKTLYLLFCAARIPVIRMGLQASSELADKSLVLAGPYHPALGHWVMSSVMLDLAVAALNLTPPPTDAATLIVHPKSLSRIQGLNKQNIEKIKKRFCLQILNIKTDPGLRMDEVRVAL
ncbi:MAG: radical SAM protein [Desulfobacterales bacterium]|jgi:histone acetyltransferase (RNA polymerase elongator complex component)|nr:radical SAM protein [Desulfobacterales bacterium]